MGALFDRRSIARSVGSSAIVMMLIGVCGCESSTQKPSKPVATSTAADAPVPAEATNDSEEMLASEIVADESRPNSFDIAAAFEEEAADGGDAEMASAPADIIDGPTREMNTPPDYGVERFMLFAPRGILLVELRLQIDGRPHVEALERLAAEVIRLADTDGDGVPTWREVSTSPRFMYGQFGNAPINNAREADNMVQLYDVNKNGRVDADEVPRFLTRNAGGSQSFSLRSSNYYRDYNRLDSPARLLIDEDEDGVISADEMKRAELRLRTRDGDDDELLYPGDFLAPTAELVNDRRMMRRRNLPDAAMLLWSGSSWSSILYSLEELYAGGGELAVEDFSLAPAWFGELDANTDGRLTGDELRRLIDLPPHLVLEASFGASVVDEPAGNVSLHSVKPSLADSLPVLRLLSVSPELDGLAEIHAADNGRLSIIFPDVEIECFVNDAVTTDFRPQAEGQLMLLDKDNNGYLDAAEIGENASPLSSLEAVDADADGKVYVDEIATFLQQQQSAFRGQIRGRVAYNEDALFTALDANNDGRLTSRELAGVASRLASFDVNGDGQVTIEEIPDSMMIGLVRGDPQQGDALFTPPTVMNNSDLSDVPSWFVRMDANADGDISPREFIGDRQLFQQLDRNHDGFFSADEAAALDFDKSTSGGDDADE